MLPPWLVNAGLTVLAACMGILALFDDATSWLADSGSPGARTFQWALIIAARALAGGCVVVILLVLQSRARSAWRSKQGFDKAPGQPKPEPHGDTDDHNAEILDAMIVMANRYHHKVTSLFGKILTADGQYHVRITEDAAPVGELLRSTVTVTFASQPGDLNIQEPGAEASRAEYSGVLLVPMLKATIGTMLDNLEPVDGSGSAVPLLSQRDTRGLIAIVLEGLFNDAFVTQDDGHESALWALRRLVCRVGRIPEAEWEKHFELIAKSAGDPVDQERFDRLKNFCKFFAVNYVLVGEVPMPSGPQWTLKYVQLMPLYGRADSRAKRVRVALGLDAFEFNIPMNLAFSAASYHFWMYLGTNMYIKLHHVQRASGEALRQDDVAQMGARAYLRVRHRQALPHAHLYTRGLHKSTPENLIMVVSFGEVPPGTLGITTTLALLSTATVLLLGLAVPDSTNANGDILAFLLAIPGFVATFIGYSMDKAQRSSLATFSGLAVVGLVSFAACLLYVTQATPSWMLSEHSSFGMTFEVNILATLLLLISVANSCNLMWRLRSEMRHYSALLKAKNTISLMFR
jgi:hypothetical protein